MKNDTVPSKVRNLPIIRDKKSFFTCLNEIIETANSSRHSILVAAMKIVCLDHERHQFLLIRKRLFVNRLARMLNVTFNRRIIFSYTSGTAEFLLATEIDQVIVLDAVKDSIAHLVDTFNADLPVKYQMGICYSYSVKKPTITLFADNLITHARKAYKQFMGVMHHKDSE